MSFIPTVLAACLLVFATCDANLLPRGELQQSQFLKRAAPPPCGTCSLTQLELQGLVETLKDLGPALQKASGLLGDLLNNLLKNLQNLKQAIYDAIKGIKDAIGPVLDRLSAAVANLDKCPALKDLFSNLKVNLYAILDRLQNDWFPLINQPDLPTTLAALSKTLVAATPDIVKLLRDLLYNLLQVLGLCSFLNLGSTVWNLLDPTGGVAQVLKGVLGTLGGNGAQSLLTGLLSGLGNVLSGIIPSIGGGTSTSSPDLLKVLTDLLCPLLNLLGIGFACATLSNPFG